MWFKGLVGFDEISPQNVRENLTIEETRLKSNVNGRSFQFGTLEIPSLEELKLQAAKINVPQGKIQVSEIVGNVQELHRDESNRNALFQAASQFNLLEMVGPEVTPEQGVDMYERDYTQGPACAIACGAGTIYRNYFVPLNQELGQSLHNQIDCLALVGKQLQKDKLLLWEMRNGYALLNQEGLLNINAQIHKLSFQEREHLKGKLKIGIQWNTEVTISESKHLVSQAYCSALPVAYSQIESIYWESFARLILEATYEATLYTALINLNNTGCHKVYLTLVGGGAFGNDMGWIIDSLHSSLVKFKDSPLDVQIVSYGVSNQDVSVMIKVLSDF
jgi:hypothetical protein